MSLDQAVGARQQQDGDHHETQGERVDEQRQRAAPRPSGTTAAGGEGDDSEQRERAERGELDALHLRRGCGRSRDLEQVVRPEAAQHHRDEVQAECRGVRRRDQQAFRATLETAAREGQEHMEEEHRRQEVEQDPDRVQDGAVAGRQAGEEHREARRDHQHAEAAVGPAAPGDEPGDDVREHDPGIERRSDGGLGYVVAPERQDNRDRGGQAPGDPDSPEHGRPGRASETEVVLPSAVAEAVISRLLLSNLGDQGNGGPARRRQPATGATRSTAPRRRPQRGEWRRGELQPHPTEIQTVPQ